MNRRQISGLLILITISAVTGCGTKTPGYEDIRPDIELAVTLLERLEYRMHRIDTFSDGTVWNKKGEALMEKRSTDSLFGFAFYGKRDDVAAEFIYDNGNGFNISKEEKKYSVERGNPGILGSPGGQMVNPQFFTYESGYKSATVRETPERYVVNFLYPDDTLFQLSDRVKIVEFDKETYLPMKVTQRHQSLDSRSVSEMSISALRANTGVTSTIGDYKDGINQLELVPQKVREINPVVGTHLKKIKVENLATGAKDSITFNNRPVLIDFWEYWCGPCIKSLPEVEAISRIYQGKLTVMGIVLDNKELTLKRIQASHITFNNYLGNSVVAQTYRVDSWPRYFLVDKRGIIRKEYIGFSDQIEKDIRTILGE